MPDAPDLLTTFLDDENDPTCKRNAFAALTSISHDKALLRKSDVLHSPKRHADSCRTGAPVPSTPTRIRAKERNLRYRVHLHTSPRTHARCARSSGNIPRRRERPDLQAQCLRRPRLRQP